MLLTSLLATQCPIHFATPVAGQSTPQAPAQPIVAPEPTAGNVSQLVDMGFPEPVVRKALVLTKDNVEAALEWVLQHMDDADAAEPPTQEQLQQVCDGGACWLTCVSAAAG